MSRSREPLNLEGEEWRKIAKYPGYEVSNLGRFRSYWTPHGLGQKPRMKMIIFNRYMKVAIHIEGGRNTFVLFAKLVAEAFLGEANGRVVLYLDGNIRNCQLSNLAYGTRQEFGALLSKRRYLQDPDNSTLGKKKKLQEKRESRMLRALQVKALRDKEHLTYREIGNRLGLSESGAYRIYSGAQNHILAKAFIQ